MESCTDLHTVYRSYTLYEMPSKILCGCTFLFRFVGFLFGWLLLLFFVLHILANYHVFGIFSLSLFFLLFAGLKNEVILVCSYLRKP